MATIDYKNLGLSSGCIGHIVGPKALGVEGLVALDAYVECLGILLVHLQAHIAVPGGPLSMLIQLGHRDLIIKSVMTVNTWCIYVSQ